VGVLEELAGSFAAWGVTPEQMALLGRAFARALPTVVLLPVFGFGPAAVPVRLAFAVVFTVAIVPALAPLAGASMSAALVHELLRGTPIAVVAAVAVWAAFMAGDVAGTLAGAGDALRRPLSWVFGLLASIAFLEAGGASAVAAQLAAAEDPVSMQGVVDTLAGGIGIAVVMVSPLLLVTVVVDVVLAMVVRGDPRGGLRGAAVTLRPLVVVLCAALLLERVAELVVTLRP
jgi:type III secretory pathway component EscT